MPSPYDILGVSPGAGFDEIRAAYRRACKTRHPDMGGSQAAFVELQQAYEYILNDLKRGYSGSASGASGTQGTSQQSREGRSQQDEPRREAPRQEQPEADPEAQWQRQYRDIEDELEELRRTARAQEEALRSMRAAAWNAGDHAAWAKLTWTDIRQFLASVADSGVKGLSLIAAAVLGVGGILTQLNIVSGLLILGSGLGLVASLALKNDKGGFMSAGLMLFGIATIYLPPVRYALFTQPLATISILICIALIFKFVQHGGMAGGLTGGALALFMIAVIVEDTAKDERGHVQQAQPQRATASVAERQPAPQQQTPAPRPQPAPTQQASAPRQAPPPAPPPDPRTLTASKDAALKFVAGIPYRLQLRSGRATFLVATQGRAALYEGETRIGECVQSFEFSASPVTTPYEVLNRLIRACDGDAVFHVQDVR